VTMLYAGADQFTDGRLSSIPFLKA